MRRILCQLGAVSVIVASVAVPLAVRATPAWAMCADTGKHIYVFTGNNNIEWIGTNVYSAWTQGPNTISYTTTETASVTATTSASVTASISDLVTTASAQFSVSISDSTSHS